LYDLGAEVDTFAVLYSFSIAYLVAPGTFDSAHVVEFVAGLPEVVKYAGKAILAAPFAFHSFNGLRHLGWDMGKCELFLPFEFCVR
jgi:succinate dehydrogenase (ubiquinone) cytochrome b560 subunit